jgi:transcriptional regulator with XRE-family HTH domain
MTAQTLIRALEATGMTPYRIAKDSGIPQPTISRIKNGQPDCMASTIEKLKALCKKNGIKGA